MPVLIILYVCVTNPMVSNDPPHQIQSFHKHRDTHKQWQIEFHIPGTLARFEFRVSDFIGLKGENGKIQHQ